MATNRSAPSGTRKGSYKTTPVTLMPREAFTTPRPINDSDVTLGGCTGEQGTVDEP